MKAIRVITGIGIAAALVVATFGVAAASTARVDNYLPLPILVHVRKLGPGRYYDYSKKIEAGRSETIDSSGFLFDPTLYVDLPGPGSDGNICRMTLSHEFLTDSTLHGLIYFTVGHQGVHIVCTACDRERRAIARSTGLVPKELESFFEGKNSRIGC